VPPLAWQLLTLVAKSTVPRAIRQTLPLAALLTALPMPKSNSAPLRCSWGELHRECLDHQAAHLVVHNQRTQQALAVGHGGEHAHARPRSRRPCCTARIALALLTSTAATLTTLA